MKISRAVALLGVAGLLAGVSPPQSQQGRSSDAAIRQILVRESIADYAGNCPCPYSTARNGSRCGGRSAYSRPGGAAPLCYPSDVTAAQIAAWRRR